MSNHPSSRTGDQLERRRQLKPSASSNNLLSRYTNTDTSSTRHEHESTPQTLSSESISSTVFDKTSKPPPFLPSAGKTTVGMVRQIKDWNSNKEKSHGGLKPPGSSKPRGGLSSSRSVGNLKSKAYSQVGPLPPIPTLPKIISTFNSGPEVPRPPTRTICRDHCRIRERVPYQIIDLYSPVLQPQPHPSKSNIIVNLESTLIQYAQTLTDCQIDLEPFPHVPSDIQVQVRPPERLNYGQAPKPVLIPLIRYACATPRTTEGDKHRSTASTPTPTPTPTPAPNLVIIPKLLLSGQPGGKMDPLSIALIAKKSGVAVDKVVNRVKTKWVPGIMECGMRGGKVEVGFEGWPDVFSANFDLAARSGGRTIIITLYIPWTVRQTTSTIHIYASPGLITGQGIKRATDKLSEMRRYLFHAQRQTLGRDQEQIEVDLQGMGGRVGKVDDGHKTTYAFKVLPHDLQLDLFSEGGNENHSSNVLSSAQLESMVNQCSQAYKQATGKEFLRPGHSEPDLEYHIQEPGLPYLYDEEEFVQMENPQKELFEVTALTGSIGVSFTYTSDHQEHVSCQVHASYHFWEEQRPILSAMASDIYSSVEASLVLPALVRSVARHKGVRLPPRPQSQDAFAAPRALKLEYSAYQMASQGSKNPYGPGYPSEARCRANHNWMTSLDKRAQVYAAFVVVEGQLEITRGDLKTVLKSSMKKRIEREDAEEEHDAQPCVPRVSTPARNRSWVKDQQQQMLKSIPLPKRNLTNVPVSSKSNPFDTSSSSAPNVSRFQPASITDRSTHPSHFSHPSSLPPALHLGGFDRAPSGQQSFAGSSTSDIPEVSKEVSDFFKGFLG